VSKLVAIVLPFMNPQFIFVKSMNVSLVPPVKKDVKFAKLKHVLFVKKNAQTQILKIAI
jgi:hypothetical protein